MFDITVGADPELFLRKGNKIVSAIGLIGGTKKKPIQMKGMPKGFSLQEDNVLVEFNIPPANEPVKFSEAIKNSIKHISALVSEQHGLAISKKASVSMPEDQLLNPAAHIFGCEPDFNVWTLEPNPRPYSDDPNLRSAGGHIHVGAKHLSDSQKILAGRWMDFYIGIPLACKDPDQRRMELYGKPGAIRFKSYGLEYRSPSNFWLFLPNEIKKTLWDRAYGAVKAAANNKNVIYDLSLLEAWEKGDRNSLINFAEREGLSL